jgi:hypothetical protein
LNVSGAVWNLIAAILCTIAAAMTATAAIVLCLSDLSVINRLAAAAGVIGTAGGIAWIRCHWSKGKMSSHDLLIPIMAAAFMVINLLGAAFTISRVRSRRVEQMNRPSPAGPRFAQSSSFRPKASEVSVLRLANISWGVLATIAGAIAAFAVVKVGQTFGLW